MPEMAHDWINKSILFYSNYAKIMGKKKIQFYVENVCLSKPVYDDASHITTVQYQKANENGTNHSARRRRMVCAFSD